MSLLLNKRLILAKKESTYGTDPVPVVGTDALVVRNLNITPLNQDYVNRGLVRPYLGASDNLPTNAHVLCDFEVELAGSQALGVAVPAMSACFQACALAETIVASTSVTYAPVSASFASATIYFNVDGVQHKITGARGNLAISMKNNDLPVFKFSMVGLYNAVADVALGSPTYTQKTPVLVNNVNTTTFSLHSYSGVMENLDLDLGNTAAFRSLVGGTQQVIVTDRQGKGAVNMEAVTVASKDWFTTIKNGTTGALSVIHGPAGNRVTLTCSKVQLTNPRYSDSQGIAMLESDMVLLPTSGNDEISIKQD